MIKFRAIFLVILMIGFVFVTSYGSTIATSSPQRNLSVKKNKQKSGHRFKPYHRTKANNHEKANNKKYKRQTKHSFLRKR